jgi:membrane protein DedA with SNARE-associated domain
MVIFDNGHFMLRSEHGCECLAAEMAPFLARHCDPDAAAQCRTVDLTPRDLASSQMLPGVNLTRSVGPWAQMGALFAGTFASEDLTSIAAGLLIREGQVDWFVGILACFLGIFVSDLGLWLLGRVLGRGLLERPWLRRFLPVQQLAQFEQWFVNRGKTTLVAARFIPGSRTPLYLAAGILRTSFLSFALCTFVAALIWTPIFVAAVALLGDSFVQPLMRLAGQGWLALLLAIALFFIAARTLITCCSASGRARLGAKIARLWQWEFWPMWLFYLPLLPWLLYLAARYQGLMTWTAANPSIPHGGVVGESKFDILSKLPSQWAIPSFRIASGEGKVRFEQFRRELVARDWSFPLILKPDAAQRGAGVKLVRDLVDAEKYFTNQPAAVLVQRYHAGPYEAGVFYYRLPDEPAGHIFSITDKQFPVLVGNGDETVEELIWKHPRYRMQAKTFLARYSDQKDHVLAPGESMPLTVAGNHCQGTMFRDGASLMTPQLEQRIDEIARHFDGFFIGRFDVRYRSVEAFRAGNDLAIVELNGATSESTNIYDPSWSLLEAYRTLFRQWALLYRIGYANRQRGVESTSTLSLLRLVFAYYKQFRANPLAD